MYSKFVCFCPAVVAGLDIISLRRNFVEELHPALVAVLAQNGIDLNFDWMVGLLGQFSHSRKQFTLLLKGMNSLPSCGPLFQSIQEDQPRAVRIIRHVAGVRADVLPPQVSATKSS